MPNNALEAGFVRHRRFLVATSLALATAAFLGLTINEVDVAGNHAQVGHPERVALAGYVVWLWALWTYWQWFRDYGAWGKTRAEIITIRNRRLLASFRDVQPPGGRLDAFKAAEILRAGDAVLANGRRTADELRFRVTPQDVFVDSHQPGDLVVVCAIACDVPAAPVGRISYGNTEQFVMPVERAARWRATARALVELVNSTRHFSEYFAPWLIGYAPILVVLWRHYHAGLSWWLSVAWSELPAAIAT